MNPCKEWLLKTEFARVSFTQRSVSIKNRTFVYETNHSFKQMLPSDIENDDNWVVESCQRLNNSNLDILTVKN